MLLAQSPGPILYRQPAGRRYRLIRRGDSKRHIGRH
jgi:hypothetical protein